MRGPYSDYAAPPIYVYPAQPRPGIRFSRTELTQLTIAILALSGAFTVLYIRYSFADFVAAPGLLGIFFLISLLAVGTGVGLHEIMHKVVAQRYGLWAEFRYNPQGLALAFVFAVIGFIYGAPGATWISGTVTQEQNGRISAAGPLTNLVIGAAFYGTAAFVGRAGFGAAAFLVFLVLVQVATVNVILGGFNLLPIMPLDGAKVWRWNKLAYGLLVLAAAVLLYQVFVVGFA